MGAVPSSSKTHPSLGSNFNAVGTRSDKAPVGSFQFHGHTVTLDEKDVADVVFLLNFKSVIASKRVLQEKFISAASTEAKLLQQLHKLKNVDRSKKSPQELQQLDKDIASVEKALEDIGVDTTLNKIGHKPQEREAIIKDYDRSVKNAADLSFKLTEKIARLFNAGLIQPQEASTNNVFSSKTSSAPFQQKIEGKSGESKAMGKVAEQRNQQAAQQTESLRTDEKEQKGREAIDRLGQQFTEGREKESSQAAS